jgi:hypothetical protein
MNTLTISELKTFHFAFQISRKIIFNVSYYFCGGNTEAYFSTSADQFNGPKTDYNQCGQAQNDLLKGFPAAMAFYKKFDPLHLEDLTADQHADVLAGIEKLKSLYNWIESSNDIDFSAARALSMMKVK